MVRTFSGQRCDRQQDGLRTMDSGHRKNLLPSSQLFTFATHPAPAPLQTIASKQLLIVPLLKTSLHQDVLALSLIPPIFSMHVYIVTRIFSIIVWRLQILTVICFCC